MCRRGRGVHSRRLTGFALLTLLLTACNGGGGSAPAPAPDPHAAPVSAFSVSGTIHIQTGTAVDSDTNDAGAPATANDTADQAQELSEVRLVGGYVTASPTGRHGDRFAERADTHDVFRVPLRPGQRLSLAVSARQLDAAAEVDLSLSVFPAGDHDTAVVEARSLAAVETLSLPSTAEAGPYDVVVQAHAGASKYVLELDATVGASAGAGEEFVTGDLIVQFRDEGARRNAARIAALGLTHQRGPPGQAQLLALGERGQREEALRRLGVRVPTSLLGTLNLLDDAQRARHETILALQALRARADVVHADLNYIRRPQLEPNDPHYPRQWHYALIGLPKAWKITTGRPEVIVAVVDSGVFMAHPDLQENLLDSGYDFVRNVRSANDGDGIDPDPDDPGDSTVPGQSSFHGTHVAGTIAAVTDNGRGVAGAAPNVRLMPLRVCGIEGCTSYDVMQAVRYAVGMSNDSGTLPPQPANVINISLGGGGYSQAERNLVDEVRRRGALVAAAAGNSNSTAPSYPAAYEGVLSVGAVDARRQRAYYSNYGPHLSLMAPGGDTSRDDTGDGVPDGVLSTLATDRDGTRRAAYGYYQGTSMAAPHVSGVIALMKSVYSDLTPELFDRWLHEGRLTDDLGAPGRDDEFGYGLINAQKAVQYAQAAAAEAAQSGAWSAAPGLLDFGPEADTLRLYLQPSSGAPALLAVESAADWLQVTPLKTADDGGGSYQVRVERLHLPAGSYAGKVLLAFADDTQLQVPVLMQVAPVHGDAGRVYVLLVDAASGRTVAEAVGEVGAEGLRYQFVDVPPGSYRIVSGTDLDNDGFICGAGEACGAYPSLSFPEQVTVDRNLYGLDFSAGFALPSTGWPAAQGGTPPAAQPRP
jgi:serine protease